MKKPILVSSNQNKLKEFARFGLDMEMEAGRDLPEVQSDPLNVVIYKALAAGQDRVVEDTCLIVNGQAVVDIRWKLEELRALSADQRPVIEWVTLLGHNTGKEVKVYRGSVMCELSGRDTSEQLPSDVFGFDADIRPVGEQLSFYQLEKQGQKDLYSARKMAALAMLDGKSISVMKVDDIQPWIGEYQGD